MQKKKKKKYIKAEKVTNLECENVPRKRDLEGKTCFRHR